MKEAVYECKFCHKKYKRERSFIAHKCKEMIREEYLGTPDGQAAFAYYQEWMALKRHRVKDTRTFLNSGKFESFRRFVDFAKKVELPHPDLFIKFMVSEKNDPTIWRYETIYSSYMQHIDGAVSPMKHVQITLETLDELAVEAECFIGDIFNHINTNQLIDLIRKRRISPWVLLKSIKFTQFLYKIHEDNIKQYIILEHLMNPKYWKKRFEENPKIVNETSKLLIKLEL